MRIGYACVSMTIDAKTTRRVTLKKFTEKNFLSAVEQNLIDLQRIIENNIKNNITMFRISSDIIPLGSHSINNIQWHMIFEKELTSIGEYIKENNIRVSMHPGQYTVLNAENDDIVVRAIKDLEYHCRFLDSLQVNSNHKIILHVGGIYGDKKSALERFAANYKRLPANVKKRLVIENDERNYSIHDVLELGKSLKIPVIFDNLHHACNINSDKKLSIKSIINEVKCTWTKEDGAIKVHYSQQDENRKRGAHSKTINIVDFLEYYEEVKEFDLDIMLEVKNKDISVIKVNYVLTEIAGKVDKELLYEECEKYKYLLMERNLKYYDESLKMASEGCSFIDFYKYIDNIMNMEIEESSFINTVEEISSYLKKHMNKREEGHLKKILMDIENKDKIKEYLKKICEKYNVEHMLKSYYFSFLP